MLMAKVIHNNTTERYKSSSKVLQNIRSGAQRNSFAADERIESLEGNRPARERITSLSSNLFK